MNRADLLRQTALAAVAAGVPARLSAAPATPISRLNPPAGGVPVAFLLSEGAVMIDFAGPWEVFQDADVPGRTQSAFIPFTVAQTTAPIEVSGGARIVPQYDFTNVPSPKVVVVPAQSDPTPAAIQWLRTVAMNTDVVMSVCTGAFVLAKAGLLDGHTATTHHGSLARLAMEYPNVTVRRGARFVDEGHVASSAGLSAGIDLALHIVSRYYGQATASQTAYDMEYQSRSWMNADSNAAYARPPSPHNGLALCAVCWMEVNPKTAISSVFRGKRYYFCMPDHKKLFDSAPLRFLSVS